MRILQIIQKPQLRGAEIFASQLSNQLFDAGQDVQLVSLLSGEGKLPFKGKHIRLNRPLGKRFMDITGWKELARHIQEYKPDVVQANAGDTLKYAVLSKIFFKWDAPIVFRNASVISSYIKSIPIKLFNQFLFSRVSYVISVSEQSMQDFLTLFPFMQGRISVIPIGVSMSPIQSEVPRGSYLLHVGGFTFEKNHEGLLRIMKALVQKQPSLELWLVGDGALRSSVESNANELGLQSNIRCFGYQKDVISFLQKAKVLLLPSIIEGLPGVILESMYCRTPVVAYDVGGISEVVQNGKTGWLVKAGDEDGFVKAVQEILSGSFPEIIENAYQLVTREYDNKQIAKRFLEVYEKVASRQLPVAGHRSPVSVS